MALKNDGTVWTWGSNFTGGLGNSAVANYTTSPVQVENISGNGFLQNVTSIFASHDKSVAIIGNDFCSFSVVWGITLWPQILYPNSNLSPTRLLNLSNISCCSPLGGSNGTISSFNVNRNVICPNECIDFNAVVGSGQPSVQWIFPGSTNNSNQPVGININNICYDTPGTYPVLAYVNDDFNPTNTGISITVLDPNHRKCQYEENDDDNSMNRMAKEYKVKNQFKIYPNPSKAIFNIDFTDEVEEGSTYTVEDITGKRILEGNVEGNNLQVDLKQYNEGIYFLRLRTKRYRKVIKLVKN